MQFSVTRTANAVVQNAVQLHLNWSYPSTSAVVMRSVMCESQFMYRLTSPDLRIL